MKKLKKGLSLVLVLAMVLSLFSVSVFAANPAEGKAGSTYTDAGDASYGYDAVEVLSGLGILNGLGDGTFDYDGDFTRAEAAKIVSLMLTNAEYQDDLVVGINNFSDVPDDSWYAKYVTYANSRGIVAGYGNGKFGPADTLTKEQWMKMLLVAMGFDAETFGLVGDNWINNTVTLAVNGSYYMGVSPFLTQRDYSLPFNRETAAYYAFKAMQYTTENPVIVSRTLANGITITQQTYIGSMFYEVYGLTENVYHDIFARTGYEFLSNGKPVFTQDVEPVYSTNVKTSIGEITKELGIRNTEVRYVLFEDGIQVGEYTSKEQPNYLIGGQGALTEVYPLDGELKTFDYKAEYKICVINTYVEELGPRDFVPGDALTDPYVNLINQAPTQESTDPIPYIDDSLTPGDVVLYCIGNYALVEDGLLTDDEIPEAAYVTPIVGTAGQLTKIAYLTKVQPEIEYITVDGKKELVSRYNDGIADKEIGANYNFYTDFYGNIIYATVIPEEPINYKYAYAVAFATHEGERADDEDAFKFTTKAVATVALFDYEEQADKGEVTPIKKNVAVYQAADGEWYYTGTRIQLVASDEYDNAQMFVRYVEREDGSIVLEPVVNETLSVKAQPQITVALNDEIKSEDYYVNEGIAAADTNREVGEDVLGTAADMKYATDDTPLYRIVVKYLDSGIKTTAVITKENGCKNYTAEDYDRAIAFADARKTYIASELAGVVEYVPPKTSYTTLLAINVGKEGTVLLPNGDTDDVYKFWYGEDLGPYLSEDEDRSVLEVNDTEPYYNVITYKLNNDTKDSVKEVAEAEGTEDTAFDGDADMHYIILGEDEAGDYLDTSNALIVLIDGPEVTEAVDEDVTGKLKVITEADVQKGDKITYYTLTGKDDESTVVLVIVERAEPEAPPADGGDGKAEEDTGAKATEGTGAEGGAEAGAGA